MELLPPVVITLLYVIAFKGGRNRFIEAFLALMYVKSISFFIFSIYMQGLSEPPGFNPDVSPSVLGWVLFLDFLFQFFYCLQEFLTWSMVTLFAVVFGLIVLLLRLAIIEPMRTRLSGLIRIIGRGSSASDDLRTFGERINALRFVGVPDNPLDPDVQSRAWADAWKDYLIIGLATLLPSIPVYMESFGRYVESLVLGPAFIPTSPYVLGVLVFLTWIYRFGYPASNRLAKSAGLKLGNRDLGSEMMRGVLGWFFRLNILVTIGFITIDVFNALSINVTYHPVYGGETVPGIMVLMNYYVLGVMQAAPPILFAIIVMPLVEKFAVVLYKKLFEWVTRDRLAVKDPQTAATGVAGSILTGSLTTWAFSGLVLITTLFTADRIGLGLMFDVGIVSNAVLHILNVPFDNVVTIVPSIWLVILFAAPLSMMLLNGFIGHYVRDRIRGGLELFSLSSGLFASVATYVLFPSLDYTLNPLLNGVRFADIEFTRIRWAFALAPPEQVLYRYAYQFIVNVPIWVSASLLVLYYFEHRRLWRQRVGIATGNLLNVTHTDVKHAVFLFTLGLAASVFMVLLLSALVDPLLVAGLTMSVVQEIGLPEGLESVFVRTVTELFGFETGRFMIYLEHNAVRTLIMLLAAPVFWSLVVTIRAAIGRQSDQVTPTESTAPGPSRTDSPRIPVLVGLVTVIVTGLVVTLASLTTNEPFPVFSENLAWYAAHGYGIALLVTLVIALVRVFRGESLGHWWFPPVLTVFTMEYFIYDDQFTVIALIVLPGVILALERLLSPSSSGSDQPSPVANYFRYSLMSVAIAEVLSTALWVGGIAVLAGMGLVEPYRIDAYVAGRLTHGIVEIPAFLFAAAASFRIARDMFPLATQGRWSEVPLKTREVLTSGRLWRTFILVMFFLTVAALIEAYVSPLVELWVLMNPLL
ncbi:MAG: hypothetical protein QXQ81_02580 [Candidatus Thorarchaeota archaeon]